MSHKKSKKQAKNKKQVLKKLFRYMKEYKFKIILVIIFSIISTVFNILGPKSLGDATTEVFSGMSAIISGNSTTLNFDKIISILVFTGILYITSVVFLALQNFIVTSVSVKITYRMRRDVMDKIHSLPLSYFDKVNHGEVISRMTNDIDTITQTINESLTQLVVSVSTVIGIVVMMITISPIMTLIILCTLPLSFLLVGFIVKHSQKYFKAKQDDIGNISGYVEEIYSGQTEVQAFGKEEETRAIFEEKNKKLQNNFFKAHFLSGISMPGVNSIANIGYVFICVVGAWLITGGVVTIGGIQAFIQYVRQFNAPIQNLSNISNIFQQTFAATERVFDFLGEDNEEPDCEKPLNLVNNQSQIKSSNDVILDGSVEFKNVCFGYNKQNPIIKNFSTKVTPGYKVAIVGATGAGKTTLVKLLMRFYDIDSGSITLSGYDINKFTRDDLRSVFGMVLQDTWLFKGSVMENLKYGNLNATDEEVYKATKIAQIDDFIKSLPDSYDTIIDVDNSSISQGQKQLLTIARAILANPKMLILDEATSSVDTKTEKLIVSAMEYMMHNRTSFVIAHRLSTVTDADVILVLDNGNIVETGTHTELMQNGSFYKNIYNSQFALQNQE